MSKHPYTYSADFIRAHAGHGARLSRADASNIRESIALALGVDDRELACKLSDYFQDNELEIDPGSD